MARNVILNLPPAQENTYFNPYSKKHRKSHDCIQYFDQDKLATCIGCQKILIAGELVFDNNYSTVADFQKKKIKVLVQVAEALKVPGWLIWYKCGNDRDVYSVKVKQVSPTFKPGWNELPTQLTWDEWEQYLEHIQQRHYDDCTNKPFFRYMVRKKPFKRQHNYEKLFHNGH